MAAVLRTLFIPYLIANLVLLGVGTLPTLAASSPAFHEQLAAATGLEGGRHDPLHLIQGPGEDLASTILVAEHHSRGLGPFLLDYLFSGLNLGLGVFLVWRRPRDTAALVLGWALVGTAQTFNWETHEVLAHIPTHPLTVVHFYIHAISGATYVHALLVFPDGRLVPARAAKAILSLVYALMGLAFLLTLPYLSSVARDMATMDAQAITAGVQELLLAVEYIYFVLFFGLLVPILGTVFQVYRYRRATREQRRQTRLVVWTLAVAFGLGLAFFLLLDALQLGQSGLGLAWLHDLELVVYRVYPVFFSIIPVALFVAILRHGVFEIDVVINRALVYGALTVSLAVVYLASVFVMQLVLRTVVGQQSQLAVVGSTLAIAALFNPLRGRLQRAVDRRFYRRKYDAMQTVQRFAGGLPQRVDLRGLELQLAEVVRETMQPEHLSLWMRKTS